MDDGMHVTILCACIYAHIHAPNRSAVTTRPPLYAHEHETINSSWMHVCVCVCLQAERPQLVQGGWSDDAPKKAVGKCVHYPHVHICQYSHIRCFTFRRQRENEEE